MKIVTVTLNPAFDRIVRGGRACSFPGGKGVNVSRVLKALGLSSTSLVAAGGRSGRRLIRSLRREGLMPSGFSLKGEVRTNTTRVLARGRMMRDMGEGPLWHSADAERFRIFFIRQIAGASVVVFSGSLPPGLPDRFYGELIMIARKAGAATFLDASRASLREGVRAHPLAIKPNRAEAQELFGRDLSSRREIKKALQSFPGRGMKMGLVTLGAQGAVLAWYGRFFQACGPRVAGHGVGCGDAALAGWIAAFLEKAPPQEQLRQAIACGAAAAGCLKPGAVRPSAVRRMKEKITIKEI